MNDAEENSNTQENPESGSEEPRTPDGHGRGDIERELGKDGIELLP